MEIPLRWGDADAYGHINNVAIMRLLEEARTRGFWRSESKKDAFPPLGPGQPIWSVVADMQISYLRQVDYQTAPAIITMWISKLGGASFDVMYQLRSAQDEEPRVTARSTIVTITAETGKPCRMPSSMRETLGRHLLRST